MINEHLKLGKDLRGASKLLSAHQARYVVDLYYQLQNYRIRAANQVRSSENEPCALLDWLFNSFQLTETELKAHLNIYSKTKIVGKWSQSICGIGPVIAAGLMAHIDIEKAPTVGHIWNFAGINPNIEWGKGQKRPFNAKLKVLCWKIGQSFVKQSNRDKDVYGKLYKQRKEYEQRKNNALEYSEQATRKLTTTKIGQTTDAYKHYSAGLLPPAHIQQRAERWATKIFLSHWHHVAYYEHFNEMPPKPFAIAQLGHAHEIAVPNWPFESTNQTVTKQKNESHAWDSIRG